MARILLENHAKESLFEELSMKKVLAIAASLVIVGLLASVASSRPADEAEQAAIRQAALDYIEGWFEGNAERMDRALHPQLAKRLLEVVPATGQEKFTHLTKDQMVEFTKRGGGNRVPADKRAIKATILDSTKTMAVVRTDCSQFIDYLTLAKCAGGQWKIVNVLWENIR
jgi:hypothetical protein